MTQRKMKEPNNTITRDMRTLSEKTGNVYKSIRIIGKRANQITLELKKDLEEKLQEFSSYLDNSLEIFENKERIEISRFFERRPKPTLLATQEFLDNKLHYQNLTATIENTEE